MGQQVVRTQEYTEGLNSLTETKIWVQADVVKVLGMAVQHHDWHQIECIAYRLRMMQWYEGRSQWEQPVLWKSEVLQDMSDTVNVKGPE